MNLNVSNTIKNVFSVFALAKGGLIITYVALCVFQQSKLYAQMSFSDYLLKEVF